MHLSSSLKGWRWREPMAKGSSSKSSYKLSWPTSNLITFFSTSVQKKHTPNWNSSPKLENTCARKGNSIFMPQKGGTFLDSAPSPQKTWWILFRNFVGSHIHPTKGRPRNGGRCARRAARQRGANLVHWTWKRLKANLSSTQRWIFREFVHLGKGRRIYKRFSWKLLETVDVSSWGEGREGRIIP